MLERKIQNTKYCYRQLTPKNAKCEIRIFIGMTKDTKCCVEFV